MSKTWPKLRCEAGTSPHSIGSTSAIASSPATEARRSSPVRTDLARGGGVDASRWFRR